jgi:hypothetical protein
VKLITRIVPLTIFILGFFVSEVCADQSLARAYQAQALLGPEVWSRVIRVENEAPSKRYPAIFHALVFELADILWFYTASEGTQSFSTHRGRITQEKEEFDPLLRAVDPGLVRWTAVTNVAELVPSSSALPNGCFIESVLALRARLLRGGEAVRPQLLSYYVETQAGLHGHTVLAYETGGRVEVVDATQNGKRYTFPAVSARDPLKLAQSMHGKIVAKARFLAVDWPTARSGNYVKNSSPIRGAANSS